MDSEVLNLYNNHQIWGQSSNSISSTKSLSKPSSYNTITLDPQVHSTSSRLLPRTNLNMGSKVQSASTSKVYNLFSNNLSNPNHIKWSHDLFSTKTCQATLASQEIYHTESKHSRMSNVATSSPCASTFTSSSSTTPLDSKTWICLWRQEAHTSHQVLNPNPLLV